MGKLEEQYSELTSKEITTFTELKNAEVLQNRIGVLDQVSQYVGEYFSREWVMKNVMMMSDDDIKEMQDQVEGENSVKAPDR